MTQFDQKKQVVGIQYNAETIYNGIPFEKYKSDLAKKESEIRQLLVQQTTTTNQCVSLYDKLTRIGQLRLNEREAYEAHVRELLLRINRLNEFSRVLPEHLIDEAKIELSKGNSTCADKLFEEIESQAKVHISASAEASYQRGEIAKDEMNYSKSLQFFRRATQLQPNNSRYLLCAGLASNTLGEFDDAAKYFSEASNHTDDKYDAYNNLGMVYVQQAKYEDAIIYLEPTLEHAKEVNNVLLIAASACNLGMCWKALGKLEKAMSFLELAITKCTEHYGDSHFEVAQIMSNKGAVYDDLGEFEKAIEYYQSALEIDLINFGSKHQNIATRYNNLGKTWGELGHRDKSLSYLEDALEIDMELFNYGHPSVARDYNNIGCTLSIYDYHLDSLFFSMKALEQYSNLFESDHSSISTLQSNIGIVLYNLGRFQMAIQYLELAHASFLALYGHEHPSTVSTQESLDFLRNRVPNSYNSDESLASLFTKTTLSGAHNITKKALTLKHKYGNN